jgi:Flp pilus assembly protein TadG
MQEDPPGTTDLDCMTLIQQLVRLRKDSRGNVTLIFALSLMAILGSVGVAVDYTMASRQRTVIQSALDAAMLAGAIAGKASLDSGAGKKTAIEAAKTAAANAFKSNLGSVTATLDADFKMTGLNISGTGSASASVATTFMAIFGHQTTQIAATAQAASAAQPYLNVYLLIDISASMLLPSTSDGISKMIKGQGCALACHDKTDGSDSYSWALSKGIQLRYQVVNQGIQNLLDYLQSQSALKSHVKIELWSFDHALKKNASMTSSYSHVSSKFPSPSLASTDASAATPFNSLIDDFVATVGAGGDGSSASNPQKMVIIATDGVNDPTREWVSDVSLRSQVRVFDTSFCKSLASKDVTLAIINTPYYPMTWDWGYNVTLGQPGSLGGATRVDDIPIALKKCAGKNFTIAADVTSIQQAFTNLFVAASPIRLTK